MEPFGVVYMILNLVNGKKYVGQTVKPLKRRFNEHARSRKSLISKAIRKYGKEKFYCGVIVSCSSKEEMDEKEKFYIDALHSRKPFGYNLTDGGGGVTGFKHSPETHVKMSLAKKGKYTGKDNPNYGKHYPESTCSKIGAAKRGYSPFENLLAEIDSRQLSYRSLAKLLESSHTNIFHKIRGKHDFTELDKAKLVEIFGKPIEYLLECETPPEIKNHDKKKRKPLFQAEREKSPARQRGYSPYKNLLAELEAHQLSYRALEKLMGVARLTIARKMRGEYNFTERDKTNLTEIFGKPIEFLLQRSEQ